MIVLMKKKKRTWWTAYFAVLADHWLKLKESKKRLKCLNLEQKKFYGIKVMVIPVVTGSQGTIPEGLVKRLENKRTTGGHLDYSIVKISRNTEKSPGDLKRLSVTQTPVENDQQILVWKTLKGAILIILSKQFQLQVTILNMCNLLRPSGLSKVF